MKTNPFSLAGKTILVTGASSGIGQATAIACSRLGANLVITARNPERLQKTLDRLEGEGHRQILADLTTDEDLERFVAACPESDGLVLCAGMGMKRPLNLCDKSVFSEIFDVNFAAPVECLRRLLKARKITPAGSVVFVASVAGMRGGTSPTNAPYGVSKAALVAVMRYFALEFRSQRIRFNAVNPGLVKTPLAQAFLQKLTPEQIAADIASYPLGRYGEPDDVAHGIVYLLSDASSWVTGQQLVIDGGLTL